MSILSSLKRLVAGAPPSPVETLYGEMVGLARQPEWYLDGAVPDTMDGRFDMVVLMLSLLMLRLEGEMGGDPRHPAAQLSADLADHFITDMEGNLRQDGVGDQAVPKHMGHMMAALGGRLGAYREAGSDRPALIEALRRNLYRGAVVSDDAVGFVAGRALAIAAQLGTVPFARLAAGSIA